MQSEEPKGQQERRNGKPSEADNRAPAPLPSRAEEHQETADSERKSPDSHPSEIDKLQQPWWFWHHDPIARFTGWVAAFTFVLAMVGVIQVWAFIQSERAFVSLSDLRFADNNFIVGKPIEMVFRLKNGGRSPAFISETNISVLLEKELPPIPQYQGHATTVIGALSGQSESVNGYTNSKGITEEGLNNWNAGNARFWIFGYVTYQDEFSFLFGSRTIGFCYEHNKTPRPNLGPFDACIAPGYTYYR